MYRCQYDDSSSENQVFVSISDCPSAIFKADRWLKDPECFLTLNIMFVQWLKCASVITKAERLLSSKVLTRCDHRANMDCFDCWCERFLLMKSFRHNSIQEEKHFFFVNPSIFSIVLIKEKSSSIVFLRLWTNFYFSCILIEKNRRTEKFQWHDQFNRRIFFSMKKRSFVKYFFSFDYFIQRVFHGQIFSIKRKEEGDKIDLWLRSSWCNQI